MVLSSLLILTSINGQIQCDSLYFIQVPDDTIEFTIRTYNCSQRDYMLDFYTFNVPDQVQVWDKVADTMIVGQVWLPNDTLYSTTPGEVRTDGPIIQTYKDQFLYDPTLCCIPFDTTNAGHQKGWSRVIINQVQPDSLLIRVIANTLNTTAFNLLSYCINPPDYVHPLVVYDTTVCNGLTGADTIINTSICADTLYVTNYSSGDIDIDDYVVQVCVGDTVTPEALHNTDQYPDYFIASGDFVMEDYTTIEYIVYDGFCSQAATITYEPIYTLPYGDTSLVVEYGDQIEIALCDFVNVFTELDLLYGCVYGGQQYEDTEYLVLLTNQGCVYEYIINVEVIGQIYIPNVFSPNDDGNNDRFFAFMPNDVTDYTPSIYDRWGSLVWKNKGAWDGEQDGEPVQAGTYVYLYCFIIRERKELIVKGDVTLVR